jgi:hypothetical protein
MQQCVSRPDAVKHAGDTQVGAVIMERICSRVLQHTAMDLSVGAVQGPESSM